MSEIEPALRILQISDTHIHSQAGACLAQVDVDAGLQAVLKHLTEHHWPADFILATGDLAQDEGAPAYRRLREFLNPLQVPVYCLPGNHDLPAEMAAVYSTGQVKRERHIIAKSWQFILLDSSIEGSPAGHLAHSELDFLGAMLAEHRDLHTMVCLHHHPVSVGSSWIDTMMVDNAPHLFAILDRYPQVKSVIWGHIHQEFSERRNGVQLLAVPSTCAQFKAGTDEPEFEHQLMPGYRWFELYDDGNFRTGVERVDSIR